MSDQISAAAARLLRPSRITEDTIDLSVGEPGFDTPPEIREAAIRALREGATRYTPRLGINSLRSAVCERLAADKFYRPSFEDVVITAGGSPGAAIAIAATARPGGTILIPDPSWPNYEMFAARLGLGCNRYTFTPSHGIDLGQLEALIDVTTTLIVVNSPSNPTGALAMASEIESLVDLAERRDLWILSDEAYESIVFDAATALSPRAVDGGERRTFASYTFSKTYAMTGWRVGYLIVPSTFRRAALELQATITGCAPAMAQHAAEFALAEGAESAEAMRKAYEQRRDDSLAVLRDGRFSAEVPPGAFYLWLSVDEARMSGQAFTNWLIDEADIVVSAGEVYTPNFASHIRVSFAGDAAELQVGLQRMNTCLNRIAASV